MSLCNCCSITFF